MTLNFSSDSRRDNYKLQQTEEVEKTMLSEWKDSCCKAGPRSKRAYRRAEKNGSEE